MTCETETPLGAVSVQLIHETETDAAAEANKTLRAVRLVTATSHVHQDKFNVNPC